MTTVPPKFTELADWVDGRLEPGHAEDVARRVTESGPDTEATVAWLRSFRSAAAVMPLQAPPADVGEAARAAFRRLRGTDGDGYGRFDVTFDSRLASAGGIRSTTTDAEMFHLDLRAAGLSANVDVVRSRSGLVVEGTVTDNRTAPADGPAIGVVFTAAGQARLTVPVDRRGHFSAEVPADVDELCVVSATHRLRASLADPSAE